MVTRPHRETYHKAREILQALEEFGLHPEAKGEQATEGFSGRKDMTTFGFTKITSGPAEWHVG